MTVTGLNYYFSHLMMVMFLSCIINHVGCQRPLKLKASWASNGYIVSKDGIKANSSYCLVEKDELQCNWLIYSKTANIEIEIQRFYLDLPHRHCQQNYLQIHDGPDADSPSLDTLCDNTTKSLKYRGTSSSLFIRLMTQLVDEHNIDFVIRYYTQEYPSLDLVNHKSFSDTDDDDDDDDDNDYDDEDVNDDEDFKTAMVICVGAFICIIFVVFFFFWLKKRREKSPTNEEQLTESGQVDNSSHEPTTDDTNHVIEIYADRPPHYCCLDRLHVLPPETPPPSYEKSHMFLVPLKTPSTAGATNQMSSQNNNNIIDTRPTDQDADVRTNEYEGVRL